MGWAQDAGGKISKSVKSVGTDKSKKKIKDTGAKIAHSGAYTPWDKKLMTEVYGEHPDVRDKKEAERKKKKQAAKDLADAKKKRPKFNSILTKGGNLKNQYKLKGDTLDDADQASFDLRDERFLDQMRTDGLRESGTPSTWRDLQQGKINRHAGDVQDNLESAQLQQLDAAAMRGGVGAGARERMGQAGVRDSLMAQQEAYGLGLDADIADEQMRKQDLMNLSGVEMGLADRDLGASQFNIGNQMATDQFNITNKLGVDKFNTGLEMGDITQKRLFDMGLYSEGMKGAAAKVTAASAPGGGGKK